MTEAPSPPHNTATTTGMTLQDHHGGDRDKKEMVKLEVDGGGESALAEDRCSDGVYDKPLPCYGCGVGWFSFLLGFAFPPLWYYATVLYFGNFVKDPRERPGLAASAIAVRMIQRTTTAMYTLLQCFFRSSSNSHVISTSFSLFSRLGCPASITILLAAHRLFLQEMQHYQPQIVEGRKEVEIVVVRNVT